MPSRAIAPVVGASHVTVQSDMRSSGKNLPDAPRTVKSLDGVGWTAMHLLCKVHCRMQCKTATFAMQREKESKRERERGGREVGRGGEGRTS